VSARDVDHAEQLFGRIRGVLERAEWGTKAERTNVAWAILDEILRTPAEPPRLALARALVPECAVVPREPTREMLRAAVDADDKRTGNETCGHIYRAMLDSLNGATDRAIPAEVAALRADVARQARIMAVLLAHASSAPLTDEDMQWARAQVAALEPTR